MDKAGFREKFLGLCKTCPFLMIRMEKKNFENALCRLYSGHSPGMSENKEAEECLGCREFCQRPGLLCSLFQ